MIEPLHSSVLGVLFRLARTRNAWREERLPESVWRELYDLMKFGPTSFNSSPARLVFVTTAEAKARLAPHLSRTNRAKSMAAPAIVIVAHDLAFAERIPELFPHNAGVKSWFEDPGLAQTTALRNGSLQGAYLILAARALGFDVGPMSGFDAAGVDREFFAGTTIQSNFLCAIGHGIDEPMPRLPRLSFDDACRIV